jgi:gamma-glutamyltranspeptidase/glutathione hydrolase
VTYPRAGNIGGGGFMLVHLAKENRQLFIDYRELAPASAFKDIYLDKQGNVDKRRYYLSRQSAGVPGTVAGLAYALEKYGSMTLKQVLKPAIDLADKGFPVSFSLSHDLKARASYAPWADSEAKRLFFKADGSAYEPGENLRQVDLAWTLKQIARHGPDAFYRGAVAKRIVADMAANDGLITAEDLANYEVKERKPVRGTFKGYEVVSAPPPSSGGIHIVQMLNVLEQFDLKSMGHNSAEYLHTLAEAMKMAYADRSKYLGDPDFYTVPVSALLDKKYAAKLAGQITSTARPAASIAPALGPKYESSETTHYSVADKHGNVVSNTYTLNFSFGSGIAVPGTGMLLNNEMADFSAKAGVPNPFGLIGDTANAVEPRKRPLSSMSPTLIFKDGQPWVAAGSPGGSRIITTVLQTLLNVMVFDFNIAEATALPRIHHQWLPDKLQVEEGISVDTVNLLKKREHPVHHSTRTIGRMQSIMLDKGIFYGASDPRRAEGAVAAY